MSSPFRLHRVFGRIAFSVSEGPCGLSGSVFALLFPVQIFGRPLISRFKRAHTLNPRKSEDPARRGGGELAQSEALEDKASNRRMWSRGRRGGTTRCRMNDPEIAALAAASAALAALDDPQARARVLRWINEKFGYETQGTPVSARGPTGISPSAVTKGDIREIPGVARLSEAGEFRLTVRDLKASSANDAAVRLAHIAIRAYQQLTGQRAVSSKSVVVPVLKTWRVYDGNTRRVLAQQKGIVRRADELDLDIHAESDADRYIAETLDESVEGKWRPGAQAKGKGVEKPK